MLKAELEVVHPSEAGLDVPWLPPDAYGDRQCMLEVRAGPSAVLTLLTVEGATYWFTGAAVRLVDALGAKLGMLAAG